MTLTSTEKTEGIGRRGVIVGGATSALAGLSVNSLVGPAEAAGPAGRPGHHASKRGEFVIRGGHVLTLDASLGLIPSGDVHVRDGVIMAVGRNLKVPRKAQIVDARNRIVMPGFIDGHWHLWNTMLKSKVKGIGAGGLIASYTRAKVDFGPLYRPVDSYRSVRLGLAEALLNGVTTVMNFNHNVLTPDHADAELQAHHEMGVRTLLAYGTGEGRASAPIPEEDVRAVQKRWFGPGVDTRVVYGLAIAPGQALAADVDLARRLGVPIAVHGLAPLLNANLVGPDVLVAHSFRISRDQIRAGHAAGVRFSTSATIEACLGPDYYSNAVQIYRETGALCMSVDSSGINTADMFNAGRAMLVSSFDRLAEGLAPFTQEEVVRILASSGAHYHGLSDKIGSIAPGKQADLQLLRTDDANLAPFEAQTAEDAFDAIVYSGNPQIVDAVMVDGRMLVSGGRLVAANLDQIVRDAQSSMSYLSARAGR